MDTHKEVKSILNKTKSIKRKLVREIMNIITPLMHTTGFSKGIGIDGNLKGFFFKRKNDEPYKIREIEMYGFFEGGLLVTDLWMCAASSDLEELDLKTLYSIYNFVISNRYGSLNQ